MAADGALRPARPELELRLRRAAGDAVLAVNGTEAISCKQTIKLLTEHTNAIQLTLCTRVVHGGWMHKLGEGLGGWTTRYFTLAYELEMTTAQVCARPRVCVHVRVAPAYTLYFIRVPPT